MTNSGQAAGNSAGEKEVEIFRDDFESGNLTGWRTEGGQIEVINEGGRNVLRIVSKGLQRRQEGDESIRWADSEESAFAFMDLPAEKLTGKRVWIYCRYRLTDTLDSNDWAGMTLVATNIKTGDRSWRGGRCLPTKDPTGWTSAKVFADITKDVDATMLRLGFGRADGTLLIDEVRITIGSQTLPQRTDEVIAESAGSSWKLTAPDDGRWQIGARWAQASATKAKFKLSWPGGNKEIFADLSDKSLAGWFNPLAVADLKKGQSVEISTDGQADAARLLRVPAACAGSEVLYANTLDMPADMRKAENENNWVMEGGGAVEWSDGFLRLIPKRFTPKRSPVETDHFTFWLKNENFPSDFAVEWEFRTPHLGGLVIIFFSANGINGEDVFDPKFQKREGVFERYYAGDINCYHMSYYAGGRGRANIRKNYGFNLVFADEDLVVKGGADKWHRMRMTKFNGMLELTVNGQRCLTWQDDGESYGPVLGGGKFSFRQQNDIRHGDYRNLRFYALKK